MAVAQAQVANVTIVQLAQEKHILTLGLAFIDNGKVVLSKVYGELKKGIPAPGNTVFNVAWVTKTITLRQVNSDKWDLDEPIGHYWTVPDVAVDPRSKRIITRHILTHQLGPEPSAPNYKVPQICINSGSIQSDIRLKLS